LVDCDGGNFERLTKNTFWDLYPVWSPDDSKIAFLSFRESTLDIYMMNADGSQQTKFYDSGQHDADIHWIGNTIVFTSGSKIWKINEDGTNPLNVTNPPRAGEWGNANLPFGDYDPNLHPQGTKIIFERLENDTSTHGNYNIYSINVDGTDEVRLTENYYSQGFPTWSHTGDKILLIVAAIEDKGQYHLYMMNADGMNYQDITPEYFPENFLCHQAIFSPDDTSIYFIGEWWE
jgi:TolB protein